MPRATKTTEAPDTLTEHAGPTAATIAGYADMTAEQLAGPGPDLPDDDTLTAAVDNPPRNRWGVRPIPATLLPLPIRRALWRWDAAEDLATDLEARAAALATDADRDKAAADADLALVLAGKPAHHAADLAHERDSITRAAADLRQRAILVGENAHAVVMFDGEGDPNQPDRPALLPHLRSIVGPDAAAYLDALDRLTEIRARIAAEVGTVAGWWRSAARPDYHVNRGPIVADDVTIPAELVSVTFDGVRNPRHIAVKFATFAEHDRAALAALASPRDGQR